MELPAVQPWDIPLLVERIIDREAEVEQEEGSLECRGPSTAPSPRKRVDASAQDDKMELGLLNRDPGRSFQQAASIGMLRV